MNIFRNPESNPLFRGLVLFLCLAITLTGCGHSVIQVRPPYHQKLRVGDGVKITVGDGTTHAGRVLYTDKSIIVIRTPRQTTANHPVQAARFGTTIPWEEVRKVKVAGTLDSQGKLISNEEIRVNRRTNLRRNLLVNIGLLGLGASFFAAVKFQDSISPASTDPSFHRHGRARFAFWTAWIGGTLSSTLLGYQIGGHLDRQRALARIEHQRAALRQDPTDSLLLNIFPPRTEVP